MRRRILTTFDIVGREPATIPFSAAAMKANLLRLQNEWQAVQASRNWDAIYPYLATVFEMVAWWDLEGKAVKRAHRALRLQVHNSVREQEPFAALILFARPIPGKVDDRTREQVVAGLTIRGRVQTLGRTFGSVYQAQRWHQ